MSIHPSQRTDTVEELKGELEEAQEKLEVLVQCVTGGCGECHGCLTARIGQLEEALALTTDHLRCGIHEVQGPYGTAPEPETEWDMDARMMVTLNNKLLSRYREGVVVYE